MAKFEVEGVFRVTDDGSKATLDGIKRSIEGVSEAVQSVSVEEVAPGIGELNARVDALAQSEREAAAAAAELARQQRAAAAEAARADATFQKQVKSLLGFGSAVAVLATVQRAISAIANASEESRANFDALSNQIGGVLKPAAEGVSTVFGAMASALRQARDSTDNWSGAMSKAASITTGALIPGLDTMIAKFRELAEQERLTVEAEIGTAEIRKKTRQAEIDQLNEIARLNGERKSQTERDFEDTKRQQEEFQRNKKFQEDVVAALEKEAGAQFKLESERRKASQALADGVATSSVAADETLRLASNTESAADAMRSLGDDGFTSVGAAAPELLAVLRELADAIREIRTESEAASRAVENVARTSGGRVDRSLAARTTNPISRGFGGTTR